jgi:LysW-gamma-L-alpha-aminoadipyl-6-phosphate/LysW-L-glutamyl-5-phosphate reductase
MTGEQTPIRVSIVGGSGYAGGELARLLLMHPHVTIAQVSSQRHAGAYLHSLHPNLRPTGMIPAIRLVAPERLEPCDVLFVAQPHGTSMNQIAHYQSLASRVVDLSADFRLRRVFDYQRWYGHEHPQAELLERAVYGIPELHRAEIVEASLISGAGCLATAAILGLRPLVVSGLLDRSMPLVIEAKVGSSAAGAEVNAGSHHPDRSHSVRSYAPTGHRHTAELEQELDWPAEPTEGCAGIAFSATAVELVRGVLVTAHAFTREPISDADLWPIYRSAYGQEPFIRIVKGGTGNFRYPDPKLLAGSNFCDVGFAADPQGRRVVVMSAIDNLMKGAAGNAVQAMNVAMGWPETTGLTFPGLHPI